MFNNLFNIFNVSEDPNLFYYMDNEIRVKRKQNGMFKLSCVVGFQEISIGNYSTPKEARMDSGARKVIKGLYDEMY